MCRLLERTNLRTAKEITGRFSHPSPCPLPVGKRVQRTVILFAVLIHRPSWTGSCVGKADRRDVGTAHALDR